VRGSLAQALTSVMHSPSAIIFFRNIMENCSSDSLRMIALFFRIEAVLMFTSNSACFILSVKLEFCEILGLAPR
jgi:hypothetical protein